MRTLENLIHDTGGCGRFQVFQLTAINSVRFVAMWGVMFMAFGNFNPGWRCDTDVNVTSVGTNLNPDNATSTFNATSVNMTGETVMSLSEYGDTDSSFGRHDIFSKFKLRRWDPAYNVMNNATGKGNLTTETQAGVFQKNCDGFDSCPAVIFDPDAKTIVTEWGLACHHAWKVSLIISIQMAGLFFGCTSAGQISERFGRRTALYSNSALYSIASLVAAFSVSWPMHAACLFFIGIGAGGVLTVALVFSFEFLDPRWRGLFGGLPLINLSQMTFSLLVFLERDWRHLHITLSVISGVLFLPVFWVPESMRWLAVQGRINEAKAVICKIARTNNSPSPEQDDMAVLFAMKEHGDSQGKQRRYTYLDLFKETHLRSIIIRLAVSWICEVTVYYALIFAVKAFSGDFYLNLFIYSMVDIPVILLVGPLANRFGRKKCGASFFFFSSLTCLAITVIKLLEADVDSHAVTILILATLTKTAISGGRCVVQIVTNELPPTVVRNLCYGFCMLFSRFGTIIAPYLIPEQRTFHVSFSIMAGLLFLTGAVFISLPETKDRPMADKTVSVHDVTERDIKSDTDSKHFNHTENS